MNKLSHLIGRVSMRGFRLPSRMYDKQIRKEAEEAFQEMSSSQQFEAFKSQLRSRG